MMKIPSIKGVVIPFLAMSLILLARGDSRFPLSKTTPLPTLMLFVLAHTLFFIFFYILWIKSHNRQLSTDRPDSTPRFHLFLFSAVGWMSILGTIGIHYLQYSRFKPLGYQWTPWIWGIAGMISLILAGRATLLVWGREETWFRGAALFLGAFFILKIPPILDFPLTVHRSDMLLNIEACGRDILQGVSPYQFHQLGPFRLPNVRMPAMLMAYLPSTVLNLDLRWCKLAYETASAIGLLWMIHPLNRKFQVPALILMLIFWGSPYLAFRHEIYDPPFWLMLLATLFTAANGRWMLNALAVGTLVSMHQWGCAALPFLIPFQCKTLKTLDALKWAGLVFLVMGIFLGPYLLGDRDHFIEQLLITYGVTNDFVCHMPEGFTGGWERIRDANPYCMSFYSWVRITDFGFKYGTGILAALLALCWLICRWIFDRKPMGFLLSISVAWLLALLMSPVSWIYQYFTILFFIMTWQIITWSLPESSTRPIS